MLMYFLKTHSLKHFHQPSFKHSSLKWTKPLRHWHDLRCSSAPVLEVVASHLAFATLTHSSSSKHSAPRPKKSRETDRAIVINWNTKLKLFSHHTRYTLIIFLDETIFADTATIRTDCMFYGTGIIGITFRTHALIVDTHFQEGVIFGVLLTGASSRNIGLAIGSTKWTTLAIRCTGEVILYSCVRERE